MQHQLPDEKVLLNRLSEGDEQAFRVLFDLYKNKVYDFALRFTRSEVHSEEIVQEIFLKIWKDKTAMAKIAKFESWLFIITRNKSFNVLRKIAYEHSFRQTINTNTYDDSVEDQTLLKQYHTIVHNAVQELTPQQKKIYQLRREEGLSVNEISEKLNLSPNTVKVHLTKAFGQLRKALDGKLDGVIIIILTSFFTK